MKDVSSSKITTAESKKARALPMLALPLFVASTTAGAATLTPLHAFTPITSPGTSCNSALLVGSDARLHGTAAYGGNGGGATFSITVTGSYLPQYYFPAPNSGSSNGLYPYGGLIQDSSSNYYGTTIFGGGTSATGTVYKIAPNNTETVVHAFNSATEGSVFYSRLLLAADGNFYGVASQGGQYNAGTVFKITPAGVVTVLHTFTGGNDGSGPRTALIQDSAGTIYGATPSGGQYGYGTLFKIQSGTFSTLYTFTGNADGGHPGLGLVKASDGYLYGTTIGGTDIVGSNAHNGTVFKLSASKVLTTLHYFTYTDGSEPYGGVMQASDGKFYGTTLIGGASQAGTIFSVSSTGAFSSLYSFANGTDGTQPMAGLVQTSDGSFYGCTQSVGSNPGTIFKFTLN